MGRMQRCSHRLFTKQRHEDSSGSGTQGRPSKNESLLPSVWMAKQCVCLGAVCVCVCVCVCVRARLHWGLPSLRPGGPRRPQGDTMLIDSPPRSIGSGTSSEQASLQTPFTGPRVYGVAVAGGEVVHVRSNGGGGGGGGPQCDSAAPP